MIESAITRRRAIPIQNMTFTTGTWTPTNSSGLLFNLKSAADETTTVSFTLPLERRNDQWGVRLRSIELPIRVTTANLDAVPSCVIYRNDGDAVVAGATGDFTTATIATTDNGVVTADANDRRLIINVTSPQWDYDTEASCTYSCVVSFNCAAGTVLRVYPAEVIYDELV